MKAINISKMGNAQNQWLSELDFYRQDLQQLRARLTEIAGKYTSVEIGVLVEQFENRFRIQLGNMDRLKHDIKEHLKAIRSEVDRGHAGYVDHTLSEQYEALDESYRTEEKIVNDLRHEFNRFSAAWM